MPTATRVLAAFALLTSLAALSRPAHAEPVTWKIDPAHTEAGFEVRHFFSKVHGVFHDVDGTIVFDEANPTALAIDASAKVASVDTGNKNRDADLQTADFFDAEKYPTMDFKSTRVEKKGAEEYSVTGDLTIHGVTKSVTFAVEGPTAPGKDPWGNTRIGISATTKINRKDFGLNWNVALEAGGVLVGDRIKIDLEVQAARDPNAA